MRAVVTVVGKDKTGIIARVSGLFYEKNINILDISQTIVKEYFNMLMIIDGSKMDVSFGEMVESLDKIGEELGMSIKCQREEIFTKMHRI